MTYVQRLPQLQLSTFEIPGRTITLLLVAGLHVFIIALIIKGLETRPDPVYKPPRPIVYLPPISEPVPPRDVPGSISPAVESLRIVAEVPKIDIEREKPVPERVREDRWSGGSIAVPPGEIVRSLVQPRQDPDHPLGRPDYPAQSIRLDEAGTVVLNVCVDATGRLTDIDVAQSSGFRRLDQAAMKHLRKPSTRLLPGTEDGRPVPMCTDLRVRFGFDIN